MKLRTLALVVLLAFPLSLAAHSKSDESVLRQVSRGFSRVAKGAIPAVVYIECQSEGKQPSGLDRGGGRPGPYSNPFDYFQDDFFNRFFGYPYPQEPQKRQSTVRGSGFIVSPDGYIMTNNHVVAEACKIQVTLHNGRKVPATVIGKDPKTELAVIKIDEKNLPYLNFGNSDELEVGDWAIAIGNPFGLQASVTMGIVSAKGRNQLKISDFEDFIQTDAAVNPGNSGGPLLDIDGEVIGINTAIASGTGGYMGVGFAIPSNMAKNIMDQIVKNGEVVRGYIGIAMQPIDGDLADYYKLDKIEGVLVSEVIKGSPAESAGLKQEDIIVSYNGHAIESIGSFRNAVSLMAPGSKLALVVNREGKLAKLTVTVATLPGEKPSHAGTVHKLGLAVTNLTPELSQELGYLAEKGVVITQVQPDSPAAIAALKPGTLIVAINRKKVSSVDDLDEVIKHLGQEKRVLLMVRQGDAVRFITLHFD